MSKYFIFVVAFMISNITWAGSTSARIESIERTVSPSSYEVTLRAIKGEFNSGAILEVSTAGGKKSAKIILPEGIETFREGMTMRRVMVSFDAPATIAPGQIVGDGSASSAATKSEPAVKLQKCPFTAAELSAALGLPGLKIHRSDEHPFNGALQTGCDYLTDNGPAPAVTVVQLQWTDQRAVESTQQTMYNKSATIPGDPDQARWSSWASEQEVELAYIRKKTNVKIKVHMEYRVSQEKKNAMKEKLLRLRRIP